MRADGNEMATVQEVKSADTVKNLLDGNKADLYINNNKLGGKHLLVRVNKLEEGSAL